MTFPLRLALGLTFLALPLVELALLIKVGGILGFWPVMAIIFLTALAGGLTIRSAGLAAVSRMFSQVQAGGNPMQSLLDQFLQVTGGVLLILPGFIGDSLGALLLIPAVRSLAIKMLGSLFTFEGMRTVRMEETRYQRTGPDRFEEREARSPGGTIIEGEYERIDDTRSGNDGAGSR